MIYIHPIFITLSLLGAIVYSLILNKEATKKTLKFSILIVILITIANGLFVNRGFTVVFYFRQNAVTLESLFYGFLSGAMMLSVTMWFVCYNEIITSDKFLYIFSKTVPNIALIANMTLRLIPKFMEQIKIISKSQKTMGLDYSEGNVSMKIKSCMRILSILITWSLEDAVQTADSMKARGYGMRGRTSFSIYKIIKRDIIMLSIIILNGIFLFLGYLYGYGEFVFYPTIGGLNFDKLSIALYICFFIFIIIPIIIELVEVYRWKFLEWKN